MREVDPKLKKKLTSYGSQSRCRSELREQGAGNVAELDGQQLPPDNERGFQHNDMEWRSNSLMTCNMIMTIALAGPKSPRVPVKEMKAIRASVT